MKLNAEQIKKALECCTVGIGTECEKCPYMLTKFCNDTLKKDVLSLIKELTEENERLRESNVALEQKLIILGCDEQYVFKAKVQGE